MAYFRIAVTNLQTLERCLAQHVNATELQSYPVYIAASNAVFQYPHYLSWRQKTKLRLVNKTDLITGPIQNGGQSQANERFGLGLGREEWAAIEAVVLVHSQIFIGTSGSTLTEFVVAARTSTQPLARVSMKLPPKSQRGEQINLLWDKVCAKVITKISGLTALQLQQESVVEITRLNARRGG